MAAFQKILKCAWCIEKFVPPATLRHLSSSIASPGGYAEEGSKCIGALRMLVDGGARKTSTKLKQAGLTFTPSSINLSPCLERQAPCILPTLPGGQPVTINLPATLRRVSLEMPTTKVSVDNTHISPQTVKIEAPHSGQIVEKMAIRMIRIRRRKMKKHQLKKHRKKFRVLIMKVKQRRNQQKERVFLSGILQELKAGEAFSAQQYVADKLQRAYEPTPVRQLQPRPLPWEFQPLFYESQKPSK